MLHAYSNGQSVQCIRANTCADSVNTMGSRHDIGEALAMLTAGVARLQQAFRGRSFTLDGRLVGDIGEVIAALEYDLALSEGQTPTHDAVTADGRNVQIKATFKDRLAIRSLPDYLLGLKLRPDGGHEEIYNGPGRLLAEAYRHRAGFGTRQLSFPLSRLRELSAQVPESDRIPRRGPQPYGSEPDRGIVEQARALRLRVNVVHDGPGEPLYEIVEGTSTIKRLRGASSARRYLDLHAGGTELLTTIVNNLNAKSGKDR